MNAVTTTRRAILARLAILVLLTASLRSHADVTVTYISVEPIPSQDVIGAPALATIESVGYRQLARWSERLLEDCDIVQRVIDALDAAGAIDTINRRNTDVGVAAGGFEGITNPSFVFTVEDSGRRAASAADINVLDNALGYVLNQGGTAHFSLDDPEAYDFPLEYAVVSFRGELSGRQAQAFFDHLGTIDEALWSGPFAGFTQVALQDARTNNSMVFLQPAVEVDQFVSGLSLAARTWPRATYVTRTDEGRPTTAPAGIAFPGNDWLAFPNGDQYLANLGTTSPQLLEALAALRQQHLRIVAELVDAIEAGHLPHYLGHRFSCAPADGRHP
jgi:hypothetical protein